MPHSPARGGERCNGHLKQKPNPRTKIFGSGVNNNKIKFSISVALLLSLNLVFFPMVAGYTVDELNKMKQERQQKLNDVQKRISSLQTEIRQKQNSAASLKNEIAIVDLQIAETEAQIEITNGKIDVTNLDIAEVTDRIVKTESEIADQKDILRGLIAEINDLDQRTPLEIALENDNFGQFLDQLQYTISVQERSQSVLNEIKRLKIELEIKQADLKRQKTELDNLKAQLATVEAQLSGQRVAKQQVLDKTRGQERAYQRLLAESEGLEDAIEKEIYDLEVELRAKLGNRRLPAQKGLLAWPIDGTLTQGYGNTGFRSLGYNFHNGIDIAAPAGTPIYAAADGVVLDVGTGNGAYGNWVTIKHTISTKSGSNRQLITLYAHMSSFRMKDGQSVKQGDLVGFEGNTGNTTRLLYGSHRGYHIHFTVFDVDSYGVAEGANTKIFGPYRVPYGATYNPFDFL